MDILRGEVYYAELPEGRGSEQSGIRPVVIISNNKGNKFSPTVVVACITTANKVKIPTHVYIDLKHPSTIMTEQVLTLSKFRLKEKICTLSEEKIKELNRAIAISFGI